MENACPGCGKELNAHLGVSPEAYQNSPTPGSILICLYCNHISVVTEEGLREPTNDEREQFDASPEVILAEAVAAIAANPD